MANSASREKFRDLMQLATQEQNFFWQRFGALATLHAALIVLVTATLISERFWAALAVSFLSALLAILWIIIQGTSVRYVDRWKPQFHAERERLGITSSIETSRCLSPLF